MSLVRIIRASISFALDLYLICFPDQSCLQGQGLKVYSIHPGIVYTDLYVNVWWMKPFSLLAKYVYPHPLRSIS